MMTHEEQIICRLIQRDLAMNRRPYGEISAQTGIAEQDVLAMIKSLLQRGLIRKFGAIVRHREAGFTGNAMIVWAVPEDRCEQVGQVLSSYPEITHCYERTPAFEGKYNLFSMIHLRQQDINEKVKALSAATGIQDYQVLMSKEEFKKSSMEYFA